MGQRSFAGAARLGAVVLCVLGFAAPAQADTYRMIGGWGSPGSANGQFDQPVGIALHPNGNVYVLDRANRRVQIFTPAGTFVDKFGSQGSGDGQFNTPSGILIHPVDGEVYVSDGAQNRVQVFNTAGVFQRKFGTTGAGNTVQFNEPRSMAWNAADELVIADKLNHRVQTVTKTGTFVSTWGAEGDDAGQLRYPTAVAVDASGDTVVVNDDRIDVLRPTGAFRRRWGSFGTATGKFDSPHGVVIGPPGVLVADSGNDRVQIFHIVNTFLRSFTTQPNPEGLAMDSAGTVYVSGGNRVQKYALSPEVKVALNLVPVGDPGRFDLKVNGDTVAAGAGHQGQGGAGVASGSSVTVAVAAAGDTILTDYDTTIDCGAGPQTGASVVISNVTADTTCTVTNTLRPDPVRANATTFVSAGAEQQFPVPAGVTSVHVTAPRRQGRRRHERPTRRARRRRSTPTSPSRRVRPCSWRSAATA